MKLCVLAVIVKKKKKQVIGGTIKMLGSENKVSYPGEFTGRGLQGLLYPRLSVPYLPNRESLIASLDALDENHHVF